MTQQIEAAIEQAPPGELRVIRLPEVIRKTGLSRTTIYMMSRDQLFPEAVSLGGKAMGWIEAEINQWIKQRMAARQRTPAPATRSM